VQVSARRDPPSIAERAQSRVELVDLG
jgi:hypothetical protein